MSDEVLLEGTRIDLKRDLEAIEENLTTTSNDWNFQTGKAIRHILSGGGKKARPLLTCSFLRGLGRDPSPHTDVIAAVELAHTGSLLHDDIIDDAQTRRGRSAAHLVFGIPTAILAGDVLLVEAIGRVGRSSSRALRTRFSKTLEMLCTGQALERESLFDPMVDVAKARLVNRLKTASLFSYAAEAGAILARAGSRLRSAARTYGMALGEAFQLTDDLLDLLGKPDDLGKPIGRDLLTGLITAPVAIALERDPSLKKMVLEIWRYADQDVSATRDVPPLATLRDRMEQVGAFAAARGLALAAADRASAAASSLPVQLWRDQLTAFALASAYCPEPSAAVGDR